MKNILIFLLLILVSCSRTSHLTLYSNQEFDRKHFTIDTLKKGDQIFGEYGTKAFLFFSDNYDLDAKNGLQLNLNHTADNAFKYSKSKILVDVGAGNIASITWKDFSKVPYDDFSKTGYAGEEEKKVNQDIFFNFRNFSNNDKYYFMGVW